ncbi:Chromo (CHRromatin Organisation MOdifier) domain containing protein, putative [Entamoeba histolytica]
MGDSNEDRMIVEDILTQYISGSIFSKLRTFKCYDPDINKDIELPENGEYYLVKWKDYSILECSWVERSKLEGNIKIDPNNIFKEFIKNNQLGSMIVQPALNKEYNADILMPEKIINKQLRDDSSMGYFVKWNYNDEIFISSESSEFFTSPEYSLLIKRYEDRTKPIVSIRDSKTNPKGFSKNDPTIKYVKEVIRSLKRGNVTWCYNSLQFKFELFKMLYREMTMGLTGPFIFVTEESNIPFYKENINRFFPDINITFLLDRPTTVPLQKIRKDELYRNDKRGFYNGIIISTPNMLRIKRKVFVDILFCDMDPQAAFQFNFFCEEKSICILYDKFTESEALRSRIEKRKLGEVSFLEYTPINYYIKYIDVFLHMKEEQINMYNTMKSLMSKSTTNKDLCLEMMKRILTDPSLYKGNNLGCKVEFIIYLIKLILNNTQFKIAVLGDYDKTLRTISEKLNCNMIEWELNFPLVECICSLMFLNDIESNEKENIIQEYKKKNGNRQDKLKINNRIVCVDNSCSRMFLDLSMIDIVIDLSNEYSPLFESIIRTKYLMLSKKNLFVFELTISESLDEITTMMNELDQELSTSEKTQIYYQLLTKHNFKYGYTGKLKPINETYLINDLLTFKSHEEIHQIVLDVDNDQIRLINGFAKKGKIYPIDELNEQIDTNTLNKSSSDEVQIEEHNKENNEINKSSLEQIKTIKSPTLQNKNEMKLKDLIVGPKKFNKERILEKYGRLDHEGNVIKQHEEIEQNNLLEQHDKNQNNTSVIIPIVPLEELKVVPMDDSDTSEEIIIENELHKIFKKYIPTMRIEKINEWLNCIESCIHRFGSNVSNWKIDKTQFVPITSFQLQIIVNEILSNPNCPKEVITHSQMYSILSYAMKLVYECKTLLPVIPSTCLSWDISCDIALLMCISNYGLGVTELYLNDFVIGGVLSLGHYSTTEEKIKFLNSRIDNLVDEYFKIFKAQEKNKF